MNNNLCTSLFNLTSIHQKYWKDFCDVCYSRFGFEQSEVRSYEQKYDTFCRCKMFVTEDIRYEQQLMNLCLDDLRRLKEYADGFFALSDARDIIPALYYFVRQLWNVESGLKSDRMLVKYICPRRNDVDYSSYCIELKKFPSIIKNNRSIREVMKSSTDAMLLREMMGDDDFDHYTMNSTIHDSTDDGTPFDYNPADGTIEWIVNYILDEQISYFNSCLQDFIDALSDDCDCTRGSEIQAFVFRLFMSYEESLSDIKERLEEYPTPRNLKELCSDRDRLIEDFVNSRLGEHWIDCISEENGIDHIAKFFMHQHKRISEAEEHDFFYTLDKICIITDIIEGKADKYWLDVDYPQGWKEKLCMLQSVPRGIESEKQNEEKSETEKPLCVAINSGQRQKLDAADEIGIIAYNRDRQGYDKGKFASQALVAYLCGKLFCGDYSEDGIWKEGSRFDDAQYCQQLFGFDVAGTRRKARGSGAGKSPVGYEKIDKLFNK